MIPFRGFVPEPLEQASDPSRLHLLSSVLYPVLGEYQDRLELFSQVDLLSEGEFVHWAKQRSVPVFGTAFGTNVETFWRQGWLRVDGAKIVRQGRQRFLADPIEALDYGHPLNTKIRAVGAKRGYDFRLHPFRIYPLLRILNTMGWSMSRSSVLYPKGFLEHATRHVQRVRTQVRSTAFMKLIDDWNGVADLAILLEPLYWPQITRQTKRKPFESDDLGNFESQDYQSYRESILKLVLSIPKAMLAGAHADLRYEANQIDGNQELYLILRASNWRRRERLKSHIGCALWLRHMAEVIRLAFDEIYEDRLVHEDEAGSQWVKGARTWSYGSEYPLDDPQEMVRRVLPRYGIASSPRVRFYVEGDTEEGALEEGLQGALGYGVEIVNFKSKGWDDWLLLQLQKDVEARRLSMVMLDGDRKDHVDSIRRRVVEKRIVGMVFVHKPDIELGNFSVEQLVRATEEYEWELSLVGLPPLDATLFSGVKSGKEFDVLYGHLRQARGLKGTTWGRSMMRIAYADRKSDMDESNGLIYAVACALRGVTTDYAASEKMYRIDPLTLKTVPTGEKPF